MLAAFDHNLCACLHSSNSTDWTRWLVQEEVDIRALPELSDEDLMYLGVSDTLQRRKLLQVARALKKSGSHRLRSARSTAPAFQPKEKPPVSAIAQCVASATLAARSGSHDSRGSPQGISGVTAAPATEAAAATDPSLTHDSGSGKVPQPCSRTEPKDRAGKAELLSACAGPEATVTSRAGPKRSAGRAFAAMPASNDDEDFVEQPTPHSRVLCKLAKLSRSALSRRKLERPIMQACSMPAAAAAASQHPSAGLSLQGVPNKQHAALPQGTGKASGTSGTFSKAAAAKHHVSAVLSVQDALSEQHAAVPDGAEAQAASQLPSPSLSKPGQVSECLPSSKQPAWQEALPLAGRPKQAVGLKAHLDGSSSGPKDTFQPCGDTKPAEYLSGALGHLLATR